MAADDAGAPKKQFMGIEAITWQKIVPLGFMFFCILFNYTILRDTKVKAPQRYLDSCLPCRSAHLSIKSGVVAKCCLQL